MLLSRALAGGGERGIKRHVIQNKKMLIRDRIKLLLDKDSEVMELSPLAGLGSTVNKVVFSFSFNCMGCQYSALCRAIFILLA